MRREEFKVYKDVFDSATIKTVFDLIAKGVVEGIESPIKIGKESNVFSGLRRLNGKKERVAIKIYRIAACDFKKMKKYLILDPRFRVAKSRRKIVLQWAKREFSNLKKAYEKGVSVPKPIAVKDNVLVMEFIGEKNPNFLPITAKLLKDENPKKPEKFYLKLVGEIKKLYERAKLVHGDLSEFNIFNYKEEPILIDLSHSLPTRFSGHVLYLRKDLKNIIRYFSKIIKEVEYQELFEYVLGKKKNLKLNKK